MTEIKICKFGGTSMADGMTIGRVGEIAKSDPTRRFFIVSAPGKRFGGEKKITDLLYDAHELFMRTGSLGEPFERVKRRFRLIVDELHLNFEIDEQLQKIEREIAENKSREFTASRGEMLIAKILSKKLKLPFVDAEELFCFRGGTFSLRETEKRICGRLLCLKGAVIPGFYGADENGRIRTFSRGGGDISGAIVARALHADLYENWTDVSGFLVCDPHIVENPAKIDALTFEEMRELSRMGASVLHHDAVAPVCEADIPVSIRNTFRPQDAGTTILPAKSSRPDHLVTGIAGGKNYVTLRTSDLSHIAGFPYEFLLSEGGKTVAVFEKSAYEKMPPNEISAEKTALVAIVGQGLKNSIEAPARILKAVFQAGVGILFSGFGASNIKYILGVRTEDFERTVRAVYEEFYRF